MRRFSDLLPTIGMLVRPIGAWLWRALGSLVRIGGVLFGILLVLACTRVPFDVHRWLGSSAGECAAPVDAVVVLGGSGMPSGPELLRLHRAALLANAFPSAVVVVVHPDTADAMRQMVDELMLRGVHPGRLRLVTKGDNTRAQALEFSRMWPDQGSELAVVTAPENMRRSVLSFQRLGFANACGAPAWDHAMAHDFAYQHRTIGGKAWAPDVSGSTGLRYTFWNYLKLEITCLREFAALAYYALNDWV